MAKQEDLTATIVQIIACWSPKNNPTGLFSFKAMTSALASNFTIVTRCLSVYVFVFFVFFQCGLLLCSSHVTCVWFLGVAGSRRVLATAVDDWSENLLSLAPVQA
jgi:hypothetical protein